MHGGIHIPAHSAAGIYSGDRALVEGGNWMTKYSLYVHLEAKPGKEQEVADFLVSALPLVNQEPETTAWFALRMGPNVFGIFDAFPSEAGRDAHLNGEVAKALMAKASDLFAKPPEIQRVDVLADKLPR
jgi:quinol monooxygenase YgiN